MPRKKKAACRRAKKPTSVSTRDKSDIKKMIEKKAYELWQQRGGGYGKELDNWLDAERIIRGAK